MSASGLVRAGAAGAILVAAGEGSRMGRGAGSPKALVDLVGRPLAAHSLSVIEESPATGAAVLVAPQGLLSRFEDELVKRYGFRKVVAVVEGGATRQESVRLGLEALPRDLDPILIHDAARPLLTPGLLELLVEKGASCGACLPGVPVAGTVKRVGPDGVVCETLDRAALREAQTPQVFKASTIREAHRMAHRRGFEATDDAALVEWMGAAVTVVDGDPENLKVTTPVDLDVAREVLDRRAGGGVH